MGALEGTVADHTKSLRTIDRKIDDNHGELKGLLLQLTGGTDSSVTKRGRH